jgi:hypothetical protein
VQFECTVTGIGWSLVGHMQGIEQIAIGSLQVPDLPPFELPTYIADQEAQNLMGKGWCPTPKKQVSNRVPW